MRRRLLGGIPYERQYLTFEALESGTFQFTNPLEYSLDGFNWTQLPANTATPIIAAGKKIMWKATLTPVTSTGIGTFSSSGRYNALGNPLSLYQGHNFQWKGTLPQPCSYLFARLFQSNDNLISAKNLSLPCNIGVNAFVYYAMFNQCTNLIEVCDLPSDYVHNGCYAYMFNNCQSLREMPYIYATTAAGYNTEAQSSMRYMFKDCHSITTIKRLPAQRYSFTFVGTFQNCTNLKNIPPLTLRANLNMNCKQMFSGCTSLEDASNITFTGAAGYQALQLMFNDCTSLIIPPTRLPSSFSSSGSFAGMFKNCSSMTTSPELPAATLNGVTCIEMFDGCSSLNHIKCLATNISATQCTQNWVRGVASTGTFVKHPDMASWTRGNNGIPTNWTVEDAEI